ncbi:MAG TPA: histidine phosphatase family protein [bacterium]|nr:histidine phosphatase family protein [bacterium]
MADEQTTTIYVTRHGVSEHNLQPHVYMGRSPGARLLPEGREQARRLAERLARKGDIGRVVCSSLPRTMETGEVISAVLGGVPVEGDDAFWELSKGTWEGSMPRTNLPPEIQLALDADPFGYRYPQGESYRDVAARVGPAFERWVTASGGRALLFVLHGDVIRALLHHVLRFAPEKIGDLETDPCALTELRRDGERTLLVRFNDDSHLGCR